VSNCTVASNAVSQFNDRQTLAYPKVKPAFEYKNIVHTHVNHIFGKFG
jgi:hypothetical protein